MPGDATQVLRLVRDGRCSPAELVPILYKELKRIAARLARRERPGNLGATVLVHEAWMRLIRVEQADWRDRAHFYAIAARIMRQVLVDAARTARRKKRGGECEVLPLDTAQLKTETYGKTSVDLEALDDALNRLAEINPRAVEVVEQRFLGGLTAEETAAVLGCSVATADREWRYARAWLRQRLAAEGTETRAIR